MNRQGCCVNLQERFGARYRIGWDADGATKGQWPADDWPWLMELRGRFGQVHPYGGAMLVAVTDRRGIIAKLRRLPCIRRLQGGVEVRAHFHVDDAEAVLAIMRPHRRIQLSAAERDRRRAQIGAVNARKIGGQAAPGRTQGAQNVEPGTAA